MQICPDLGHRVSLRTLLPDAQFIGSEEIRAAGCCCDSRAIEPGDLFVAIEGTRHDGHDHISQAVVRGCSAIVASRPMPHAGVPVCVVDNPREVYGQVCQALSGNPSHSMKVIGVTGTNGKTSTSCLIAGVLAEAGNKVGLLGTLGYFDGEDVDDSTLTTPPADRLAHYLSRMRNNECSHAVMEVSSHAIDQARTAGIRFDAACVTNVSRDHLDYHRTLHDYRRTKSKLLASLPCEGLAIINADDPTSAGYLNHINGPVLTIGMNAAAEITATVFEQCISEQTFLLTAGSETLPVRTAMIGKHHVYNCMMAAAVGLAYGIDLSRIVRGLESARHIPGRLERIECGQPFGAFIDYAHTPDALSGTLQTLRQVVSGRLICVFGAGGDRDRRKRPLMGSAVENGADLAIITSDNPRWEDPIEISEDILDGFENERKAEVILDRSEAIHRALSAAKPGDCVLIAGKGHEKEQIVENRIVPLDDCQIARDWLYEFKPFAK